MPLKVGEGKRAIMERVWENYVYCFYCHQNSWKGDCQLLFLRGAYSLQVPLLPLHDYSDHERGFDIGKASFGIMATSLLWAICCFPHQCSWMWLRSWAPCTAPPVSCWTGHGLPILVGTSQSYNKQGLEKQGKSIVLWPSLSVSSGFLL